MTSNEKNFESICFKASNNNCIVIAATEDAHEKLNKQIIAQRKLIKEAVIKIMLTEKQTANFLNVDESWLRRKRNNKQTDLPYYKYGEERTSVIRYNLLDLDAFLEKRKFHSTTEQQAFDKDHNN